MTVSVIVPGPLAEAICFAKSVTGPLQLAANADSESNSNSSSNEPWPRIREDDFIEKLAL